MALVLFLTRTGAVWREAGRFGSEAAEVEVSMGRAEKGCLGRTGSMGLMLSFLTPRIGAPEVTGLKGWGVTGDYRTGTSWSLGTPDWPQCIWDELQKVRPEQEAT